LLDRWECDTVEGPLEKGKACARRWLLSHAVGLIGSSLAGATAEATSRPLPPLAKRCSVSGVRATTFRFKAADGVSLDGAVIGRGTVGIVLAHEAFGDLCRWVPYGKLLSQEGFRVLVFDYRGFGLSATASGKHTARIDADVVGAIEELRRRGAKKIVVAGASLGGAAVLAAAASAPRALAGVVSISGPDSAFLRGGGYDYAVLDPTAAARRIRSPLLFLASKDDSTIPPASTRTLYRASTAKDKRLVVVPGSNHGVSIVEDSGAAGSRVRKLIVAFIRAHTGT